MFHRRSNSLLTFAYVGLVLLLSSRECYAQNNPGIGDAQNQSRRTLAIGTTTYEEIPFEANRSYTCGIESGSDPDEVSLLLYTPSFAVPDPTTDAYSSIGDVTPRIGSGALSLSNINNRKTITPSASGTYHLALVNDSFVTSYSVKLNCMETTLYGGYNTNANPFNFLELINITNSTVTGRIRGFNFDGTATIDRAFSISANSRQDFDLHTPAGANKYGSLIITHNSTYGGIKGAVSQYSPVSGGLQLGATVPLKSRSQTF